MDIENVDTRCVTHPVHPALWIVQARLYEDCWTTMVEGDLFDCAAHEAWMRGLTPVSPLTLDMV